MTGPSLKPFLAIFTLLRRIYLRVSLVSRERKHEKKLFHASFRNDYLSRSSESSRCLFSLSPFWVEGGGQEVPWLGLYGFDY